MIILTVKKLWECGQALQRRRDDRFQREMGERDLDNEVDDAGKLVADERCAADERAVDIGAGHELVDRVGSDGATVLDDHLLGRGGRVVGSEPLAHGRVSLLRLLRGGGEAGADGPHGLVRNHDVGELGLADALQAAHELRGHDLVSAAVLALLLELAHAQDALQASGEHLARLLVDELVRLAEDSAALRVPREHVAAPHRLEHRRRHATGVRALVILADVLRAEADFAAGKHAAHGIEVGERHADRHIRRRALRRVGHDLGECDRLGQHRVHLPVTGDQRRACGHGDTRGDT
mmetsp:Transcript_1543/g.3848  ORF Transcript_1543/g.3848 Transcript_1543/m.3848 type:complete len:293 (-) Transcript_1543:117-995(-)